MIHVGGRENCCFAITDHHLNNIMNIPLDNCSSASSPSSPNVIDQYVEESMSMADQANEAAASFLSTGWGMADRNRSHSFGRCGLQNHSAVAMDDNFAGINGRGFNNAGGAGVRSGASVEIEVRPRRRVSSHSCTGVHNMVDQDDAEKLSSLRSCKLCGTTKTPLWRSGPQGPKSLCNACGIRFKKARRAAAAAAAAATAAATTAGSPNDSTQALEDHARLYNREQVQFNSANLLTAAGSGSKKTPNTENTAGSSQMKRMKFYSSSAATTTDHHQQQYCYPQQHHQQAINMSDMRTRTTEAKWQPSVHISCSNNNLPALMPVDKRQLLSAGPNHLHYADHHLHGRYGHAQCHHDHNDDHHRTDQCNGHSSNNSTTGYDSLPRSSRPIKNKVGRPRPVKCKRTSPPLPSLGKLVEDELEQAAFLLMALSCGLVLA